jgi:hypothetical protein
MDPNQETPRPDPSVQNTEQAVAALGPQKMPFDKKWWQLPRTVYIVIGIIFLLSLGSTVYLFFAPQSDFKSKVSLDTLLAQTKGSVKDVPTLAPTARPTDGVILVDSPTPTPVTIGSPTPTGDVTVSWLTFKNYVYGYSFAYPPDWTVTDLGNLGSLTPSEMTVNPSNTTSPNTALTITITSSTRTFAEEVALRSSSRTTVNVNGLTGSLTQEQDSNGNVWTDIVLQGAKYTYILTGKSSYSSTFTPFYGTFKLL